MANIRKIKKGLQLSGVVAMLLLVITLGMKSTFDGYFGFYYEEGKYEKPAAYKATEAIVDAAPISFFLSYTGFDTGYGFFAPNVASDFVLIFDVQDSAGNTISQRAMPAFRQKESSVRYTSMYNLFLDKISKKDVRDGDLYLQYLDVVIRQAGVSIKKSYPGAAQVKASLYLYDYPSLERFRKGERKEQAILISEYKI